LISDIGDAVVADLNGGSWSQSFTAVRLWLVQFDLADLATLRVAVTPGPSQWQPMGRGRDLATHATDVILQKKIDPTTNAAADALVALLLELTDHYRGKILAAGARSICCLERNYIPGNSAAVDPAHLDNPHVFNGVLRLTWTVQ